MTSFRGQASWDKMMSPGGKLTALACCMTKKVLYFIEYSAHFFTWKMMLKYSLRTKHGR
jgi:hypothetical protein